MALKIPAPQNWKKRLKFLLAHPEWPHQKELIERIANERALQEAYRGGKPSGYLAFKQEFPGAIPDTEVEIQP